jgi:hypothetical protein
MMTVEEANRATLDSLARDADWVKRHALAALFTAVTWTYNDANDDAGSLVIQPLANGDTVQYVRRNGVTAIDTHQYAQAAAISDAANPYDDFFTELSEHMGAVGPYVAYISTSLKATTLALANFIPVTDSDVVAGNGQDTLRGTIDRGMGDEVLGKVDGVWIVEWGILPSGYGFVVDRGASSKPLRMREHPADALKGAFAEDFSADGNSKAYRLLRYAGFGAYNRVAALVFLIGSGSYTAPATLVAPLAI